MRSVNQFITSYGSSTSVSCHSNKLVPTMSMSVCKQLAHSAPHAVNGCKRCRGCFLRKNEGERKGMTSGHVRLFLTDHALRIASIFGASLACKTLRDMVLGRCWFTGWDASGLPCLRIRSVGLCPSSNLHRAGFMPGDVRFLSRKFHRIGGCASRSCLPFDGGSTGL